MDELKPCPFCGETKALEIHPDAFTANGERTGEAGYCVRCNYLKGGCGAQSGYEIGFEKAVSKWNRRDCNVK